MQEKNFLIPGSIVVAGVIIALAVMYVGGGGKRESRSPGARPNPPAGSEQAALNPVLAPETLADDDPFLGSPDAPVTIVEFGDFQCPFCRRFFQEAEQKIIDAYVKTGKAKFVYRDFPLSSIHALAQRSSEASECAQEQGKFWQYHDILYQRQDALSEENLKRWAAEVGLHAAQFNACLDSGAFRDEVAKDFRDGQAAGVNGTPTLFINGRIVVGALPFEQFQSVIDAELAKR